MTKPQTMIEYMVTGLIDKVNQQWGLASIIRPYLENHGYEFEMDKHIKNVEK